MNLNDLNSSQKLAVLNTNTPTRIIAGAGSGKTRVITYKIAHLIHNLGINSQRILAVTFTNKAANEMKERLINLVFDKGKYTWIYTYHAFCARVLRREIKVLGYNNEFNIIDTLDKIEILKEIVKSKNYNFDISEIKKISTKISYWKNHQILTQDILNIDFYNYHQKEWSEIYRLYLEYLPKQQIVDFDDLLILTLKIFNNYPEVLSKWQDYFQYILVDEFQDTNELQFQLIQLLVKKHHNITVVGDPDQTIYSFRGAKSSLILNFENYFPESQTFILNENYRSTQQILDLANNLINNNKSRIEKHLYTKNDLGKKPQLYHASSPQEEAEWVASKIRDLVNKNVKLKNIVILYRSNYLSRNLESALASNGINYNIFGGFKFFERKEIKDVLAYLKVLIYEDQLSLLRILKLIKGIGTTTISNLQNKSQNLQQSLFSYLINNKSTLKPALNEFINYLITWKQKIEEYSQVVLFTQDFLSKGWYYQNLKIVEDNDRIENIKELYNQMENFDNKNHDQIKGAELLKLYLEEVSLFTDQDDNNSKSDLVNLMTIHNSKGLEYDYVFIIGLNEGIFPANISIDEGTESLEEERRIFYVAVTRCKKGLFLSYRDGFNYVTNNHTLPSRFLAELNSDLLEKINVNRVYKNNNEFNKIYHSVSKDKNTQVYQINKWSVGDLIEHSNFGKGVVTKILNNNIEVSFSSSKDVKILRANHPLLNKI